MEEQQYLSCEERLRKQELFSLENRRLRRNFINVYKYILRESAKRLERLFPVVSCVRMRGNRQKLEHWKFP